MSILSTVESVAQKNEHGFVVVFHAIEHEVPAILSLLVNIYGPKVIANAIATHQAGVTAYADKAIETAEADTKALVQSTLVERFGLTPTAGQFIASGIHHLFAIGEDKVNTLIAAGAARLETLADPTATPAPKA